MGNLTLILALSAIMWYLIEQAKPLWANVSFHKYITIGVSALFAFAFTFGFGLDVIAATGLFPTMTVLGQIVTGLTLMTGSSGIAEVMERVQKK